MTTDEILLAFWFVAFGVVRCAELEDGMLHVIVTIGDDDRVICSCLPLWLMGVRR